MADSEVVKAIRKQREEIARNELDTLKRMARLWVPSYKYLEQQVNALTALIQQKRDKGEQVEIEYLYSLDRYKKMMAQAKQMIRDYNKAIAGQIRGTEAEMVDIGHQNAKQMISIAEPDDPMWTRVNKRETRIMAGMTAEESPLDSLLAKSFGQMKEGMESALITGISTGQGSSWIAQQLMKAAEIPEQRALLIARTEVNRTYRQSNWEQMRSSRAIRGYRRMCYPETACFACLMLDGEFYPVDSEPCDHPNGKCSFVPVTKHFDPADDPSWQRGRDWFMQLDPDTQRKLIGPGRFELWKQGGVDPRDMVFIKPNDIWGGSPAVKSQKDLSLVASGKSFPSRGQIHLKDKIREPLDDTERFAILNNKIYKEYGVELSDDVYLLDYANVERSLIGVTEVVDKLPFLKKVFKGFVATDRDGIMSTFEDGTIGFSRKYFSTNTKSALEAEIKAFVDEYGINNFSAKSIGYHEAGHLVELFFSYKYEKNAKAAKDAYNSGKTANTLIQSAIKSMGLEYNYGLEIEMAEQISDVSRDNTSQLLAECISDYLTNGENAHKLSKALWELIRSE